MAFCTCWDSSSSFHQLKPQWFFQPEVMEAYLPGIGTLGWVAGVWLGLLAPDIFLLNFYPPHVGISLHLSYQPGWTWFL